MLFVLQNETSLVYEGMLIQDVSYGFLMDIDSFISIQEAFNIIGYKALEKIDTNTFWKVPSN